jgi:hypothetical protein
MVTFRTPAGMVRGWVTVRVAQGSSTTVFAWLMVMAFVHVVAELHLRASITPPAVPAITAMALFTGLLRSPLGGQLTCTVG